MIAVSQPGRFFQRKVRESDHFLNVLKGKGYEMSITRVVPKDVLDPITVFKGQSSKCEFHVSAKTKITNT